MPVLKYRDPADGQFKPLLGGVGRLDDLTDVVAPPPVASGLVLLSDGTNWVPGARQAPPGGWAAPESYKSGYSQAGGSISPIRVRLINDGTTVEMRGAIMLNTGASYLPATDAPFTLAAAYRPGQYRRVAGGGTDYNGSVSIRIDTSGVVTYWGVTANTQNLFFDGLTFSK
jgi:hypothetical protein